MTLVGDGIRGPIRGQDDATPYEQTWTIGIQHQLPGNIVVDANYVGKKGTKLFFGGAQQRNFLGPQIETYDADQIAALKTYVPNPFYGILPGSSTLVEVLKLKHTSCNFRIPNTPMYRGWLPLGQLNLPRLPAEG